MFYFTLAIFLSAVITILAKNKAPKIFIIFKPLTTILIIVFAVIFFKGSNPVYFTLILCGLIFSLLGDVFLLYEEKYFVHGLSAFLITHFLYIAAFIPKGNLNVPSLIPVLLFSFFIYFLIKRGVGKYKIPVLIYIVVASVMVWMAVNNYLVYRNPRSVYIASGAILFILSDSVLALNKFRSKIKFAEMLILGSYYTAQFFIAISLTFG